MIEFATAGLTLQTAISIKFAMASQADVSIGTLVIRVRRVRVAYTSWIRSWLFWSN